MAAFAVLGIYWPVLDNGFVWDDWDVLDVFGSAGLRDPALWPETLLRAPADFTALFRPLAMLGFLAQLWAGHVEPRAFHAVNLLVHSANVFLLVLLAWRLLDVDGERPRRRLVLAGLCGLAYGLHPALIEPVTWISARPDLLMTFFLIVALLLDRTLPAAGRSRAVAAGACFFAAMLCKESAVGLMAALPLVHLALRASPDGPLTLATVARALAPHGKVYAALVTALALYFVVRFAVTGSQLGLRDMVTPARYIETFGQHVLVVIASLGHHVWGAIWPFQNIMPGRQLELPISIAEILPVAVASVAVIVAALTAAMTGAGRKPALLFLAFFVSLLPVANIVPIPAVVIPTEIVVASRYLTFPLIFAVLAVPFIVRVADAALMRRSSHWHALPWLIAGIWLLVSAANVRVTIPLWKDDLILNSWALRQGGPSFWRQANIGASYLIAGDYERARDASAAAVRLRDDDQSAWVWTNLGIAEAALGNTEQALRAYQRALDLGTDEARTRIQVAALQRSLGNVAAAAEVLKQGLLRIEASGRRSSYEAQLRYELGLDYARLGMPRDALEQLNAALSVARSDPQRDAIRKALSALAQQ